MRYFSLKIRKKSKLGKLESMTTKLSILNKNAFILLKAVFNKVKTWRAQNFPVVADCLPNAWRLGFVAENFLGFLTSLAKILAIILGKVRKNLQDFSRSCKEIRENSWSSSQQKQK